jgi:hypothetical protein
MVRGAQMLVVAALLGAFAVAVNAWPVGAAGGEKPLHFSLYPSTPEIAQCWPKARVSVTVGPEAEAKGRDEFTIRARGLAPRQDFTVFLLEVPGTPFGAAEYIGDLSTNKAGRGKNNFDLIVEDAFSSTVVNGSRVRADLNHVGFWFSDPAGDDACFGNGKGAVTPFDDDGEAGVQMMNSAGLPAAPLS